MSQSRGSDCPSGAALSASTLDSIYAWASAQVSLMRSAREALGASGCGCDLDFALIILRKFSSEAIVFLPALINDAGDVLPLPAIFVFASRCGVFIDASIRANAFLFLCHCSFAFCGCVVGSVCGLCPEPF